MRVQELDYVKTALGTLMLRRRSAVEWDGREIFEVKLNDEFLMSSLFVEGELALASMGLAACKNPAARVVVGGLGLGYTAVAALSHPGLEHLIVVEALAPVIDWHRRHLVPNGAILCADARCEFLHGSFHERALNGEFLRGPHMDAILLDIDHTPSSWLHTEHAALYSNDGLAALRRILSPNGVFAMWSNEKPDPSFLERLTAVFGHAEGHVITFDNPVRGGFSTNGIYLAVRTGKA